MITTSFLRFRFINNKLINRKMIANTIFHFSSDPIDSDDDFKPTQKKRLTNDGAQKLINKWIQQNNIVLFMKGTPQFPQCGFSNYVVQLLRVYGIHNFYSINILSDPVIREQAKLYSKWPTFPQLYLKGELIGGCDILSDMHKQGQLKQILAKKGLIEVQKNQEQKTKQNNNK